MWIAPRGMDWEVKVGKILNCLVQFGIELGVTDLHTFQWTLHKLFPIGLLLSIYQIKYLSKINVIEGGCKVWTGMKRGCLR